MLGTTFYIKLFFKNFRSKLLDKGFQGFIYEYINENYIFSKIFFRLRLPVVFIEFNETGVHINLKEYIEIFHSLQNIFSKEKTKVNFFTLFKNKIEIITLALCIFISLMLINQILKNIFLIFNIKKKETELI